MSHEPSPEKMGLRNLQSSEASCTLHPFLLADYGTAESVEVELVDHPVSLDEPQFEALVADSQCEV
jgi:hypothetical protein